MNSQFLQYFLEANVLLVILWGYYRLFLRKGTHFRFNRAYLMGILPIAFGFPLLRFPAASVGLNGNLLIYSLPEVVLQPAAAAATTDFNWSWVYFGVGAAIALVFIYQLATLLITVVRSRVEARTGYREVRRQGLGPASFGPWLFWNDELDQAPGAELVRIHELAHIRQWHSLDVFCYRILMAFAWANPCVHLLNRELRQVHEYLADAAVAQSDQKAPRRLQQLIIARQLGVDEIPLANHFSSHTKNRILMLNKTNSRSKRWALALVIPMLAGLFCLTSFTDVTAQSRSKDVAAEQIDQMPKPLNMAEWQTKIGYPKEAKEAGLEGKVIMKVLVDKDGSVKSHEFLRGDRLFTDAIEEHINELKFSPGIKDGKKVKAYVTLPLKYQLD